VKRREGDRQDSAARPSRCGPGLFQDPHPSGTAVLIGRDLPPAEALAADKHLSAMAKAMKKTGAEGTMDQLRSKNLGATGGLSRWRSRG
jgi:hypothetical protein